jgi:hypothetical protein
MKTWIKTILKTKGPLKKVGGLTFNFNRGIEMNGIKCDIEKKIEKSKENVRSLSETLIKMSEDTRNDRKRVKILKLLSDESLKLQSLNIDLGKLPNSDFD